MESFLRDLRYGVRLLIKHPAFTMLAVMTLTLGIGVNTALFTLFDAFILKPLPLDDPDRDVQIYGVDQRGARVNLFSYLDYLDYRDRATSLAGLVAMNKVAATLNDAKAGRDDLSVMRDESGYVFGQIVSDNYFSVLGAEMILGRGFLPEEARAPGTQAVAVLSYGFWQRQFNSDPDIVGRTIKLQGETFTVVGVTAREFTGTTPDTPAFWVPLMMRDQLIPAGQWNHKRWLTDRDADSFVLIGRLRPGVSKARAQTEMRLINEQLAQSFPQTNHKASVTLTASPGFITLGEEVWASVLPLPLAVALVLLIACANVANLLLARAAARQKEIGVRLALGATRWRIIRQLLTESMLLSVIGGVAGLMLAVWALGAVYPVILSRLPIPAALRDSFFINLSPDYRVFAFTILTSLIAGTAAGLAPALQASRPDLTGALKNEGSTFGKHLSQSKLRNGLVITQVAVSLALLIGAGLLVRNLQKMRNIDTGMRTDNLFSVAVSLDATIAQGSRQEAELRRRLAERLAALPRVKSVSQSLSQPLSGRPASTAITVEGRGADHTLRANYNSVSQNYFETLGIQIVRGRAFNDEEVNSNAPVVVASESTVRKLWPDFKDLGEAIGKRVGIAATAASDGAAASFPSYEIVGVARDTRSGWVWEKDETFLYAPLNPADAQGAYLLVKTFDDAQGMISLIASEAQTLDPRARVVTQRTADHLEVQMLPFRTLATIAGVLGALAMLLASIGLYGVMSFVVTQRTREIGIRIALGARSADVIALFLKEGLRLIAIGLAAGLACGVLISRLLAAVLIDLSPLDVTSFAGVSLLLAAVALLACYLPARRVVKVDPMVALRCE